MAGLSVANYVLARRPRLRLRRASSGGCRRSTPTTPARRASSSSRSRCRRSRSASRSSASTRDCCARTSSSRCRARTTSSTAKAKGVGPWRVLVRHALPNSLFGLLTIVALNLGTLIGATVIIEQIFARARDRPLAAGGDQQPRHAGGRGDRARPRRRRRAWRTCSPTCSTPSWTRGSGMGAQLPEAEAGAAATLAAAPTVAEPCAARLDAQRSTSSIPGAHDRPACSSCASSWPLFGTVPPPTGGNILDANLPSFSAGHPLGTDQVGNDLWSRLLYGGRNSLEIAFAVNLIGLVLGRPARRLRRVLGVVIDTVIMRILDVLIAFPSLVLALAIAQSLGPSKLHTIYALCFFSVAGLRAPGARRDAAPARAAVHARRAAGGHARRRASCCATSRPTSCPRSSRSRLLGMGVTIILEGALSFLGLGVPPPEPSWGNMIFDGQAVLSAEPQARAAAERVPLRHRAGLQPPRRRAARALERVVMSGGAPVDVASRSTPPRRRARCSRCATCAWTSATAGARSAPSTASATRSTVGPDAGDHRRVGLGQDRQLARDHGPAARRRATVSGSVRFDGTELLGLSDKEMRRHRGADVAMVFQDPSRSLNPTMRIGDADHRGGPRPRARRHAAPRASARSSCSGSCACPRPSSACTSTPTSSRAACASAWSSPSRWPPSPGC